MFAELLPVQKVPNTPARSPGHNYTIYTPCGFCRPLENELMRESYWEGVEFCETKSLKNSGPELLTVSGSQRYYLARILSPEKCWIITLKWLFSFRWSHDLYESGPVTRDHTRRQYPWWPHGVQREEKTVKSFLSTYKCIEWGWKKGEIMEWNIWGVLNARLTSTIRVTSSDRWHKLLL